MRFILALILLASPMIGSSSVLTQSGAADPSGQNLAGRWRVKFDLSGVGEKNLIFEATSQGKGTLLPLDTEPNNKPLANALPAVWSELTNKRVTFAGNVELPLGTCCREVGTLIFKGTFASDHSITGRAIFIASTVDEENFNGFRSTVGTFTAVRETK
jgi:hypothetical protein